MKWIFLIVSLLSYSISRADDRLSKLIDELSLEIRVVRSAYEIRYLQQSVVLDELRMKIGTSKTADERIGFLIQIDSVKSAREELRRTESADISKIRYLKGLQIIRILYDKVLSLDHHFASVRTFNEINRISNPNNYPEFGKLKEILSKARRKESAFQIGGILGSNTIASVVMALGDVVNSGLSRKEQQKEIENVECIVDFTLRMHTDLNTIYFETAFLQKSNDKIKQDIELLFRDYTKPIGYQTSLETCRSTDDWEAVKSKTDHYFSGLRSAEEVKKARMQVNIDFPVERLLQFIAQYNAFIDQGAKFYEKFRIILNSYENETQCESKLPPEYAKLKADIDLAVEKFNTAYKPVELNGTKMKEILYGINEFE